MKTPSTRERRAAATAAGSGFAAPGHPALRIRNLQVDVRTQTGPRPVLRGVDFELLPGETLTLLGESGSGKSVTANVVLGTLPTPPFAVTGGSIEYGGDELLAMSARARSALRGEHIAMVFQDSMSALNPSFTVGWQIGEMLRLRRGLSRADARRRATELMDQVRIPHAAARLDQYPHEFSGGMRQRAMIGMGLMGSPRLMIADEPTTALDVTIQAQILGLLAELTEDLDMALLLVSHDLGVIAQACQRTMVMYGGHVVESGATEQVLGQPRHPYTVALLSALPRMSGTRGELTAIPGNVPTAGNMPSGCRFHPRCPVAIDQCADERPVLLGEPRQSVACWVKGVQE